MSVKILSSNKNPELKKLRSLFQKARERKKLNLFVIEGVREIKKAITGGYAFESVFIHEAASNDFDPLLWRHPTSQELENSAHSEVILEICWLSCRLHCDLMIKIH